MKNNLASFESFTLSLGEMKKVTGGVAVSCACNNGTSWNGDVQNMDDFIFFEGTYCGNGGSSCVSKGKIPQHQVNLSSSKTLFWSYSC